MALSQILRQECKTCGKIAIESSRTKLGKNYIVKLVCGHLITHKTFELERKDYDSIVFHDGSKPREYQIDAIKFAENASFRCIIADEQGLGKTIELACILRLHPEETLPCIIVVPTTVKRQWLTELIRICTNELKALDKKFMTQIITNGKEKAMPGFQLYIVTYDILKKDDLFQFLPEKYIKTIVIDECQRIKNHLSDRAKAIQKVAKTCNNVIPMSGTPIKNNAGEFFTVLNLVAPQRFPHYQRFIDTYCDVYSNGYAQQVGGLKDITRFHEDTKDLIIRRTKSEVLKDLPGLDRHFYHVELDRKLHKAYDAAMQELEEVLYGEEGFEQFANIMAIYARLRHITGISKISEAIDFSTEFLLSNERTLTIFTHHNDVQDMLENHLNTWLSDGGFKPCLKLHSGLDGNARARLVERFENGESRILLASTLAAGEGLNLQKVCADAIMLERQWNPANEEQAEARFDRFGQLIKVSITYMLATGTIDEYFTEIVEKKRAIVAGALDGKEIQWEQQGLMKELAQILVTRGRKAWKL